MDTSLDWYPLVTKPNAEFTARDKIGDLGFPAYVPTEVKVRRVSAHSRRREVVSYPAIVGYAFFGVQRGTAPPWRAICNIAAVHGAVRFDGTPARLHPRDVHRLFAMDAGAVPRTTSVDTHRAFRAGDTAVIDEGPLRGQPVKVETIDGDSAVVILDMLGSERAVTMPLRALEAA